MYCVKNLLTFTSRGQQSIYQQSQDFHLLEEQQCRFVYQGQTQLGAVSLKR